MPVEYGGEPTVVPTEAVRQFTCPPIGGLIWLIALLFVPSVWTSKTVRGSSHTQATSGLARFTTQFWLAGQKFETTRLPVPASVYSTPSKMPRMSPVGEAPVAFCSCSVPELLAVTRYTGSPL
jgi:hypothetical protein